MRLSQFSEFSFGYALTDNLINGGLLYGVGGAPVFPSLYDEGRPSGGYDVKLPVRGAPLFLQFKIPQVVTRASVYFPTNYTTPYYRMHLRPASHSTQHQSLLEHERRGRLVFYAAPVFHTTGALNTGFDRKEVPRQSIFVRPSQIGSLDDQPHFVAYGQGQNVAWLYSEPRQLEGRIDSDKFFSDIQRSVRAAQPRENDEQYFRALADEMIVSLTKASLHAEQIAAERPPRREDPFSPTWHEAVYEESPRLRAERVEASARQGHRLAVERVGPVKAAGYLARFFLDCELLIMGAAT
jgi:hypothetical protein